MAEIAFISAIFLLTITFVVLRFTTVMQHILDTSVQDRANRARELDEAHRQAFASAMDALGAIQERVASTQQGVFDRTLDATVGPQGDSGGAYATDRPQMDNRPPWQPDDDFDYSGIGLDPTDETMPMEPLEPEGNEHRAVMVPPGTSLIPNADPRRQ